LSIPQKISNIFSLNYTRHVTDFFFTENRISWSCFRGCILLCNHMCVCVCVCVCIYITFGFDHPQNEATKVLKTETFNCKQLEHSLMPHQNQGELSTTMRYRSVTNAQLMCLKVAAVESGYRADETAGKTTTFSFVSVCCRFR
jgi:hypothetical protein